MMEMSKVGVGGWVVGPVCPRGLWKPASCAYAMRLTKRLPPSRSLLQVRPESGTGLDVLA